jgi:hypothetical protein
MAVDYSQVPIIQCAYQLALEIQKYLVTCPKSLRYQVGERLANATQDFFAGTIKANFERNLERRQGILHNLSAHLLTIRMWLRMLKELKGMPSGLHGSLNLMVSDIQRQLTAWSKWSQGQGTDASRDVTYRRQDM